jgi:hypothetical protein
MPFLRSSVTRRVARLATAAAVIGMAVAGAGVAQAEPGRPSARIWSGPGMADYSGTWDVPWDKNVHQVGGPRPFAAGSLQNYGWSDLCGTNLQHRNVVYRFKAYSSYSYIGAPFSASVPLNAVYWC